MNTFTKKYLPSLLYIFILIHPILDLITALTTRFTSFPISIGMLIKGGGLVFFVLYLLYYSNSKYKKKSITYLIFIGGYSILYLLTKDLSNINIIAGEITYLFKFMYLPVLFITLVNFVDDMKIDTKKIISCFQINAVAFAAFLIIAEITNTSFSSYGGTSFTGSVGWYYSANEISSILTMLFPFLFIYLFDNKIMHFIVSSSIVILGMSIIGTKTSFLGMIIPAILVLIFFIIADRSFLKVKPLLVSILIVVIIAFSPNLSVSKNLKSSFNNLIHKHSETVSDQDNKNEVGNLIFSGRTIFWSQTNKIFTSGSLETKIFGIGFVKYDSIENEVVPIKLIEMDPLDIFYHYGILGFIIYFLIFVNLAKNIVIDKINNIKSLSFYKVVFLYSIMIGFVISLLAGHVLGAPSASVYLALALVIYNKQLKNQK